MLIAPAPPDQAARDRIATDLDTTLFVEAGAGSGKTTALVDRVVALVASGTVELRHIAAITFTEKAGAELRDRLRRSLQDRAEDDGPQADRCRQAMAQLDGAAIGTLHSFAQRLLSEHPVEAQLPPRVEVLDEVSSAVAFDRRWTRILDQLLEDPDLERTILLLHAANVDPAKLRSLALAFERSWDLVEDLVAEHCAEPPRVTDLVPALHAELAALAALSGECIDPSDNLLLSVHEFVDFAAALATAGDDDLDLLEVLGLLPRYRRGSGKAGSWKGSKDQVLAQLATVSDTVETIRRKVLDGCAHRLGSALRATTLAAADQRRQDGRLEFHDLLVLARRVLRDPVQGPVVRASLHERYQRLLLDEFQDTDPIQIELAVRIAAADPATAGEAQWADVEVAPGRLFVVGDPKQSIYRFRRADISVFIAARERFAPEAGGAVELTANFRTVAPVIDWVNVTFRTLLEEAVDTEVPYPSQPDYIDLRPQRHVGPIGPPVAVIGAVPHPIGSGADVVRAAESRDVANVVTTALAEGWVVREGDDGWRPCRLGDITILVPARTSLPFLEDALEAARIPYRAESSSLVYATRAVRDLLMVLRAADDPTDHLRIVSALRTPLLGCGDDDLFRHKVQEGRTWSYNTPTPPDPADGIVSAGLAFLLDVHEARHWQSPAELLDRIARDRRALELGFAEGRPRDVWRRLRFVVDQARGVERGHRRQPAAVPPLGGAADGRGLPGGGVGAAGDRRRRRPHHDDPRRQGPRVPHHDRVRRVGPPRRHAQPRGGALPEGRRPGGLPHGKGRRHRGVRGGRPHRRADGLRRAAAAPLRGVHAGVRPPRPVAPPRRAQEPSGQEQQPHQRGDPRHRHGRAPRTPCPTSAASPSPLPVDPAAVPTPPPDFAVWEAERAAALAVASRPGAVAATALTDEGTPDWGTDPVPPPSQPTLFDDPTPDRGEGRR